MNLSLTRGGHLNQTKLRLNFYFLGVNLTEGNDQLQFPRWRLIARLPEPNDRRSLRIQLPPRGKQLIDDVIPRIVETQWRVVSDLGVKKTTALIALLGNLTDVLSAAGNGASDD